VPSKTSNYRDEFKTTATLFTAMACHFAIWWGIGQQVSPTNISCAFQVLNCLYSETLSNFLFRHEAPREYDSLAHILHCHGAHLARNQSCG
jgi:hypothetical protein